MKCDVYGVHPIREIGKCEDLCLITHCKVSCATLYKELKVGLRKSLQILRTSLTLLSHFS